MSVAGARHEGSWLQCKPLRGFSLFELILVIAVVSLLVAVAIERFLYYQERAEKTAMESTLVMVRMGLQLHLAELIITNRQAAAADLERENPMRWLEPLPANYAGELTASPQKGHWYYAAEDRTLVYRPASTAYLEIDKADLKELRFHVVIQREKGAVTGGGVPVGVNMVPVFTYHWF